MANQPYEIRHRDAGNVSRITIWLADTDEEKLASGLNVGDFVLSLGKTSPSDSDKRLYIARSTTALTLMARSSSTSRPMLLEGSAGMDYGGLAICGSEAKENFISLETVGTDYYLRQVFGTAAWVASIAGTGGDPPNPATGSRIATVNRTDQNASIASVKLTDGAPAGLYRVSYLLRCTTADASGATVSFSTTYTDSAGATTETSAAVALAANTNRASGIVMADLASGDITWVTTVNGTPAAGKYKIRIRCEYLG